MSKITIPEGCGNSPRQTFLKEFHTAFAKGNAEFIIDHVSEDIVWLIYGNKKLAGKDAFAKEVHSMKKYVADEMVLHNIITHGRTASANGEIRMSGKVYAFCDVYRFTGSKGNVIKEIQSYILETEKVSG
ncbi:nuclear transport factor 2 family protein [Flavivirga sp. 57AJ16]|uniref:nuclear transport factor 2 family protein n=1 Tax=Flavivirga sp. 57AJ16 TaxID=3025307 RepID=UPI0023668CD5|nr:nuclear transport factor 2 family protein [Flavivirga sp. 57AJ16]MDD7887684.1 nuclear transport factor 2 family protein [Flavivirga sp. 57AJ16]